MDNVIVTEADRDAADKFFSGFQLGATGVRRLEKVLARHAQEAVAEATRQAEADKAELVEALQWYESRVSDCRKIGGIPEGEKARSELSADGGQIARAALAKHGGNHDEAAG